MPAPTGLDPLLLPLAEAAAACYSGALPDIQNASATTHGYKSVVANHPCLAFEGTQSWEEWCIDFFAVEVPPNMSTLGSGELVHAGFWNDWISVGDQVIAWLSRLGWPSYYITGHSKGAADALVAAVGLTMLGHPPLAVRAYEPPSVGDGAFLSGIGVVDAAWTQTFNAHGSDIVTLVPEGPTWARPSSCIRLQVADTMGIAEKHKIPAVLGAIRALQ